jgi:D-alanyl-D-alanine carboxypeptidase
MRNKALLLAVLVFTLPNFCYALQMPTDANEFAQNLGLSARSYLVANKTTGQVLVSKEPDLFWTPASLTKLVTAMVTLDAKPKLTKAVAMKKADEVGGARLATKSGVSYSVKDLLYAALVASANNAANALARSTGFSRAEFVEKMNQKAKALGAQNTVFYEPSGISEKNHTTASDFAKITKAAFENSLIAAAAQTQSYSFKSVNNIKYFHKLKNTNKLLGDAELTDIKGKTGYLDESKYNFTAVAKDGAGNELLVVLFGSETPALQFKETRQLFQLGTFASLINNFKLAVLGTSTPAFNP